MNPGDPNTATIYWANSATPPATVPLVSGGGEALENTFTNHNLSDRWSKAGTPGPVFVERITVTAPGKTVYRGHEFYGMTDLGGGTWEVCGPQTFHYPARRGPIIAGYEQSATAHCFDGGDVIGYVRMVPEDDPIEARFLNSAITAASAKKVEDMIGFNTAMCARNPWLDHMAQRYTMTDKSWSPTTPDAQRDLGWFDVPENWKARWPNTAGGLPGVKHFRGYGSKSPYGTSVNEHENHIGWFLVQGMRHKDTRAFQQAIDRARAQCAYGFIDSNPTDLWYGLLRNESADMLRGTTGFNPSLSKMFFEPLIWLDELLNHQDPLIHHVVEVNRSALTSTPYRYCTTYQGGGGTRMLSHELMVLRAHWLASGEEACRAKAVSEITKVMGWVGTANYWRSPTDLGDNTMCYDEGLDGIVAWWIDQSPALAQFLPKLREIVQHNLAYTVASDGRVGYKWNQTPNEGVLLSEIAKGPDGKPRALHPFEVVYNGNFNGSWMLPLRPWLEREFPGVYTAMFDKIEYRMFHIYNGWTDFDGAEATSAEKMRGFILQGCQNWWIS